MSLPPLLAQLPRHAASTFAVEDAWVIATSWHEKLRNKVDLLLSSEESCGIGKSYEWIYFEVNIGDRMDVSAARAAALAWFALSCCSGYNGHENPVFWKCVFSELSRSQANTTSRQGTSLRANISDAYGFFDGDGEEFPRFKLKVGGSSSTPAVDILRDEANVLLFCGHPSEELESEDRATLDRIMDALASWVDPKRTIRRPVVGLMCATRRYFTQDCNEMTELTSQKPAGRGWPSPLFLLKELDISGRFSEHESDGIPWLQQILRLHDVRVSTFDWRDTGNASRDTLAELARDVLCLPGSGSRARTKEYHFLDPHSLPAFASALPLTTSIQSVRANTSARVDRDRTAAAWIAYALFHPDTPASSWTSLVLEEKVILSQFVTIMRAMGRGNNLKAMLEGRKPISDGYYRARLAAKAHVYHSSFATIDDKVMAHIAREPSRLYPIVTSDGNLEVDVCDVATDNPKLWSAWVAVVVPAFGLGWAQSTDITRVLKRPPAKVSTTKLRVSCEIPTWMAGDPPNRMEPVLSMIGRRLVHLDMATYLDFDSAADLKRALSCCPLLESLAIVHNGQLWTTDSMELVLPKLRELRLSLRRRTGELNALAAMTLPRSLHVLRVSAAGDLELYRRSINVIRHILSQPSALRVFHWENGFTRKRYTEMCGDSARRLDELALQTAQHVDIRLSPGCAAAFLSVLVQKDDSRALRGLDKDLAKIIVEFAGARITRSIVLEAE